MNRRRFSLRYKIAGIMLLVSLIPLLALGGITLRALSAQLGDFAARLQDTGSALREDVVGRNLSAAAADLSAELDAYLLERIRDVRRWSAAPALVQAAQEGTRLALEADLPPNPTPEQVAPWLENDLYLPIKTDTFSAGINQLFAFLEEQPIFTELLVTNAQGVNILLTRPAAAALHAGEAWWQQAAAPNRAGIGVTDPTFDPQGDGLTLTIALPIVEPNSKAVVGVLRARLSLQEVEGIIARRALGSEATIQMTDETSRLLIVAVPEGTLQHSTQTVTLTDQATRQAAAAAPGPVNAGFLIVEAGDETQIIGYAHTAAGDFYDQPAGLVNFSGFGWGITIAQSERIAAQVLQPLNEAVAAFAGLPALLRTVILLTLVAAAVLSLGSALWFATRITRPLIALSNMAQQVQEGDLQVQTEARSNDEVGLLAQTFNAMTAGLRERERERDIFGRVVSPEVREKLLSGELSLGGETRWVAVLFSDIRGFSTISEQMTPQEVVTMLNEYMTEMSAAIRPWGGYINNFIGDAIIAVFGAPLDQGDKEWRAVAAGLDMQRRLVMLNRRRQARGEIVLHSGIGISTGEAVAGQIGSLERLLYTVIGDAVNVAQRLETLTKEYSYNILINAATAQAIRHRAGVQLDSIGTVTLKGRTEPLEVFGVQAV